MWELLEACPEAPHGKENERVDEMSNALSVFLHLMAGLAGFIVGTIGTTIVIASKRVKAQAANAAPSLESEEEV